MTRPEAHSSLRQDTGPDEKATAWLSRFIWLCPFLAIVLATGVLLAFGLSFFTAVIVALLLVCPALLVWGAFTVRRRPNETSRKGEIQ